MSETLHIELEDTEGALPRLIGLIERRGFLIDGLAMQPGPEGRSLAVTVRPRDAGRCVHVLGRQIDRLLGMRRVA
ncbi:MAG: ACT domain-containing protein [Rhodospirillaceae bacterium]